MRSSLIFFKSSVSFHAYLLALATPWWVEANVIAAFVFFYWLLTPILYYGNVWYAQ